VTETGGTRAQVSSTTRRAPEATPAVVLQVVPRLLPGGVERDAVEIAGAVAEAGATALVATSGGPLIGEVYRLGAKPIFLSLEGRGLFAIYRNAAQLARVMRRRKVDIVHVHAPAIAWSTMLAARRTGSFFVTTCRSTYPSSGSLARRYSEALVKGDRIIAVSEFVANFLRVQHPSAGARLRLVERGVDLARFDPERVTAERVVQLAHQWRLPDGVPVVMLPGRFAPEKGQDILIEAIARLTDRELFCVLAGFEVGHPGHRDALERRIAKLRLGARMHVADNCKDMPAAYMLADVVVAAAHAPGSSGRAILEAQAMGRPVVAIDHGNLRRQMDGGYMTWLTEPGDPARLAAAIGQALELPSTTRARLAPLAIANMAARYSKSAMLDATLKVYGELLGAYDESGAADPAAAGGTALTPV